MNWKKLMLGTADGVAQAVCSPYRVARIGQQGYRSLSSGKAQFNEGRRGDAALSLTQGICLLGLAIIGGVKTIRSRGK